jgi:hypothetical protein
MAGDWIKFEVGTPEKYEVMAITAEMGWDDPDLTVGKLLRVWRWFDQQTIDGNARGVSSALLDRIVLVTGFAKAMENVGWLEIYEGGVSLPNFGRHNGETAKSRALTAKRVAKHKANAKSNDEGNADTVTSSVTTPLPREEKRREEKKELKADARSARLPDDWVPTSEDVAFCRAERPDLDVGSVANQFRDYWVAQPGAKGRKLDWPATWRNWVRNQKRGYQNGQQGNAKGLVL